MNPKIPSGPINISRYPGIHPFSKDYRPVFYGRSTDIEELYRFLNVNNLVILYGKSGLGKSSLLNAGLIPLIENKQSYNTTFIRFGSFNQKNPALLREVFIEKIKKALPEGSDLFLSKLDLKEKHISIWQYLKTLAWAYKDQDGLLIVLDQFEEIFTYLEEEVLFFGQAISEVVNNRMPKPFRRALYDKLENDPSFLDEHLEQIEFIDTPLPTKLLIGIRSDRLSLLDRFSSYIPNILRNTYELKPLINEQAEKAIIAPAIKEDSETVVFNSPIFTYQKELSDNILNFLSNKNSQPVETFLLQIICQHVEGWVVDNFVKSDTNIQVKTKDIGSLDTIVQQYYINVIEGKNSANDEQRFNEHEQLSARYFIEAMLIDTIHRNRISLDKTFVDQNGFPEDMLEKLIKARIIRQEPNTVSGISYELSHDTLIDPVLQSELSLGNLETKIEEYYRGKVDPDEQQFIESHFFTPQGQSLRQTSDQLKDGAHLLEGLLEDKVLRQVPETKDEIAQYELYQMFLAPAFKLRAEQGAKVLESERKKRHRAILFASVAGALTLIAIIATIVAFKQSSVAKEQTILAEHNAQVAEQNEAVAQEYARVALYQRQLAEDNETKALSEKKIADSLSLIAIFERDIAERARTEANIQRNLALAAEEVSKIAANIATQARDSAFIAKLEADSARVLAEARLQEILAKDTIISGINKLVEVQPFLTRARDILPKNPTAALRIAEHAYNLQPIDSTEELLYQIIGKKENNFYKLDLTAHVTGNNFANGIIAANISLNGQYLLTGSFDNTAILWDTLGNILHQFVGHTGGIYGVAFSPIVENIVTVSNDSTIIIWNFQGDELLRIKDTNKFYSVTFSPKGEFILVSTSAGNTAKLFDLKGNLISIFSGHGNHVTGVDFSPEGKYIVTGSRDNTAKLWDLKGKLILTILGHEKGIMGVKFSPDGKYILTSSQDKTLKLWNLDGKLITDFIGHNDMNTRAISFSPDGQYVLSGSQDFSSKIWDLEGNEIRKFIGHSRSVWGIAFSPDGKNIFTGSGDGTAKLWSAHPTPTRQKVIDAYHQGKPFDEVKDLIESYLDSGEVGKFTDKEKKQYGIIED